MNIEATIREYLPKTVHMSLGTSRDGRPWVCEVHFAYDEQLNLYFRSISSRRHSQEIAGNPRVAGNIVRQHALGEMPMGVYFEGIASQLGAGPEQTVAFQALRGRLGLKDSILDEATRPDGAQFYKIAVETFYIFGVLEGERPLKYELSWSGK